VKALHFNQDSRLTGEIKLIGMDGVTSIATYPLEEGSPRLQDLKVEFDPQQVSSALLSLEYNEPRNWGSDTERHLAHIQARISFLRKAGDESDPVIPVLGAGSVTIDSLDPQAVTWVSDCNNLIQTSLQHKELSIRFQGFKTLLSCHATKKTDLALYDPTQIGKRDVTEGLAVTSEEEDQQKSAIFVRKFTIQNAGLILPQAHPITVYLQRLMQKLVAASDRPDQFVTVYVLNTDEAQAFALPGGQVFVYRGLLDSVSSEAELAGVLGHEWAHVTARHMSRKKPFERFNLKSKALAFQRQYEAEADAIGAQYAWNAGYEPWALTGFFKTALLVQNTLGIAISEPQSDHPAISSRIDSVECLNQLYYPGKARYVHSTPEFEKAVHESQLLQKAGT
jgi:hypothetical protein